MMPCVPAALPHMEHIKNIWVLPPPTRYTPLELHAFQIYRAFVSFNSITLEFPHNEASQDTILIMWKKSDRFFLAPYIPNFVVYVFCHCTGIVIIRQWVTCWQNDWLINSITCAKRGNQNIFHTEARSATNILIVLRPIQKTCCNWKYCQENSIEEVAFCFSFRNVSY